MAAQTTESPWEPQPAGALWVQRQAERFRELNPAVGVFEKLLRTEAGGRLVDWIDHLCVADPTGLEDAGYREAGESWFEHPGALLPPVHVTSFDRMLLRVDSVSDFTVANRHRFPIALEGQPLAARRIALIDTGTRARLGAIERRGCTARCHVPDSDDRQRMHVLHTREALRHRPRQLGADSAAFTFTRNLLTAAIDAVGQNTACDLFFAGERDYWMSRNRAGRVQYMRQSALGLGWGNHDHHTYRSSRRNFHLLVELLELLGFHCRERFYAGAEAGWGAQVLEHPVCGIVIFADVDLSPDEITGDFAHGALPDSDSLGTIGLWCALHGEALFEAGMHHLECQFDFDEARRQLQVCGVSSMEPFTDLPMLRQCFTEGERWPVPAARIAAALNRGWITQELARRFAAEGAIGSHLEILERSDGYRGFNQTGINEIIRRTDPRAQAAGA